MPFDGTKLDAVTGLVTGLLIAARQRLETYGWCQGVFLSADGALCMLGALGWNSVGIPPDAPGIEILTEATERLKITLGVDHSSRLVSFNDRPGRTKDEVLAVFDAAIARATDSAEGE